MSQRTSYQSEVGGQRESSTPSKPLSIPTSTSVRPSRHRSRTSSILYPTPMPPVMSRENSAEDVTTQNSITDQINVNYQSPSNPEGSPYISHSLEESNFAGPSRSFYLSPTLIPPSLPVPIPSRKASKSVSSQVRPPLSPSTSTRTKSYYTPRLSAEGLASTAPLVMISEDGGKRGIKRRISTPNLVALGKAESSPVLKSKEKVVESRARATSTSIVVPQTLDGHETSPTYPVDPIAISPEPEIRKVPSTRFHLDLPPQEWIENPPLSQSSFDFSPEPIERKSSNILNSVYDVGENTIKSLVNLIRPKPSRNGLARRVSESDSEKGLDGSDDDTVESTGSTVTTRTSEESVRIHRGIGLGLHGGRYWGLSGDDQEVDYFSVPSTPSDELHPIQQADPGSHVIGRLATASLPTPALSSRSLSVGGLGHGRSGVRRLFGRRTGPTSSNNRDGWWLNAFANVWAGCGTSKTAEVLREMGWTVGLLALLFVISLGMVVWFIGSMPVTTLKHLPSSTTDLQLLSAEVRSYMASSSVGWWHTVLVVTFVGCWKHAWSVPGAVVLNILVGSLLEPIPALLLLTFITATGSLFAYLLSRPLAPLIGVLFPKPLALVRAALAPESIPSPQMSNTYPSDETVTPIDLSSVPGTAPVGGPEAKANVWRRLLIMRAGGFIPWSGMNVACGVVGVDWKVFWLTTAAGSASWSYVTASVGNILSRLAVPSTNMAALDGATQGESLTSLLRDPILITKLVVLSFLTLLPVLMKRRNKSSTPTSINIDSEINNSAPNRFLTILKTNDVPPSPSSPMSPLSTSLTRFSPTPAAFDLLSFGRTAIRQSGKVVVSSARTAVGGVGRVVSGFSH